jgi:Family of unknown function (DUF6496)
VCEAQGPFLRNRALGFFDWHIFFVLKNKNTIMAKYSKKASDKIGKVMHEYKEGDLKSGKDGKGGKVKSREQAIAIGISEAKKSGAKVPKKKK